MRVALVTVGEPLPIGTNKDRLLRAGILAELLVRNGHEVTWWTSTFDHARKSQYFMKDQSLRLAANYEIRLLYVPAYRKNVSFARLRNHVLLAEAFKRAVEKSPKPDIMICSFPPIELALSTVRYGREHGVPVIVDVRDLWPDYFLDLVPGPFRPLARIALQPYYLASREVFYGATHLIGITDRFVEWALQRAGRSRSEKDRAFPLGYPNTGVLPHNSVVAAEQFWTSLGVLGPPKQFVICFFGSLSRLFEIDVILKAARILKNGPFLFVICGGGEKLDTFRAWSAQDSNVIFPGWVDAARITVLMRRSQVGLAPYRSERSMTMNIPNKPIEYMSAGLAVVSSLRGELENLLILHNCGVQYENNNPQELAAVLGQLYRDPGRLEVIRRNAKDLYERKLKAEEVYSQLVSYLEHCADKEIRGE